MKTKLWLYEAYVEPVIQYGVLIYGTSAKTDLKIIDWLQNRIIPTLFSKWKSDSVQGMRIWRKLYSVRKIRVYELAKLLSKVLRNV